MRLTSLVIFLSACTRSVRSGGSRAVSDSRIRSKDVAPAVGRGFSLNTGSVYSDCIMAGAMTTSSFDYDFILIQNDGQSVSLSQFQGDVDYAWMQSQLEVDSENDAGSEIVTSQIISAMKVDYYYSNAKDEDMTMHPTSENLLRSGNVILFFQSCGPSFIRGIRRQSKLTSIIRYQSATPESGESFGQALIGQTSGDITKKADDNALSSSLSIVIKGFGLQLSKRGGTVSFTSMEDFVDASQTAFQAMQNPRIGIIVSAEVSPWTSNMLFQRHVGALLEVEGDGVLPSIRKVNLNINAEIVTQIDEENRRRMSILGKMSLCMRSVMKIPSFYNNRCLVNHKGANNCMTLQELRDTLTIPTSSGGTNVFPYESKLSDDTIFMKEFAFPCMVALGSPMNNIRGGAMMFHQWMEIDACSKIMCLYPGAVWTGSDCVLPQITHTSMDSIVESYCDPEITDRVGPQSN
uniref:Uncharacterized protein n=1 Tax=Corethron hystrix TaxID=216773 RepID=A0A7S1B3R2_9STRA|mmetsp:Transcript_10696/g.23514  ORF Transcript_10696/g.23514 Transcript_10696/m.23514 type:complete len:463 (+) Transcript_10696:253-1641(+)